MNRLAFDADQRLHDLIAHEPPLRPAGKYKSFSYVGDLMYSSGVVGRRQGAIIPGPLLWPQDVSRGKDAAVTAVLLILRNAQQELGSLTRVVKVVALHGYISTGAAFHEHVPVMDARLCLHRHLVPRGAATGSHHGGGGVLAGCRRRRGFDDPANSRTRRDFPMNVCSPKWGPYTADALLSYPSGLGVMPPRVIHAFGHQKRASAKANARLQELPDAVAAAIADAAQEVASGALDEQFPLGLWQAGDGNQTHINVNEVIATRAAERGRLPAIHPLDHVNRNQSSNDTWPTVVHIALADALRGTFTESLTLLATELESFAVRHQDTQKVGRTFLRDAHTTTVGKEFSAFAALLRDGLAQLALADTALLEVPQGAGAVGIGAAVHSDFAQLFIEELCSTTGRQFRAAPLPATCQVVDTALLRASNVLVEVAVMCMKLARDIELLGSGPSCGIGELQLPATGPGSSSMAGKINPTHASMLEMICMKVMAGHTMVCASLSGSRLQLNTTYVLAACSTLESVELLAQGLRFFASHLVARLEVNHPRLREQVLAGPGSLFLRSRELGYDAIAQPGR